MSLVILKLILILAIVLLPNVADAQATFTLTWKDNSTNETGFAVERSSNNGPFNEIGRVAANVTQYKDTTANVVQLHCFRVRAFLTANNQTYYSSYSNIACGIHIPHPSDATLVISVP